MSLPFCLLLPRYQSCALLLSLLPFFLSAALYFYMGAHDWPASITSAGVKSAPTLLLAAVVLSWNGGQSILGVVGGLIFSAVGDCCLVWPELFLHGMGAFAVAHLLYSLTFLSSRYATYTSSSWTRLLYLILFIFGGGFYTYLFPFLKKAPDSHLLIPVFKVTAPTVHGNTFVMVTYYLAQLLIAVGDVKAVENKDDFAKWKRT
ncbi:lysoplasmalogenase-like protein [Lates japonicus]|uniref:lysoplasmalogenase n=1 Tax=Lates japonicus TaxID=270547 RepID=A0AAD3MSI6_LATJO|nr:lysoplasmalogenase-like protein [Lates japonicus]